MRFGFKTPNRRLGNIYATATTDQTLFCKKVANKNRLTESSWNKNIAMKGNFQLILWF